MASKTPVYVAGLDRGVRPMGDWSMLMILSMCSTPSRALNFPGRGACRRRLRPWLIEDFIDQGRLARPGNAGDDGQVPRGMETSIFFKLCSAAPMILMDEPLPFRRSSGMGIYFVPFKYWPVRDSGQAMMSSAVPWATTVRRVPPLPGRYR